MLSTRMLRGSFRAASSTFAAAHPLPWNRLALPLRACRSSARAKCQPVPLGSPSVQFLPTDLQGWLQDQGGTVHGVALRVTSSKGKSMRQLVATEDMGEGQLMVSVPRSCQVRHDDVEDPLLQRLFDRVPPGSGSGGKTGSWQFKQGLALLWHLSRGGESSLLPYLDQLPGRAAGVDTPRIGLLLSDQMVQELQFGPLAEDIANQKYWQEAFFNSELASLHGSEDDPFNGMEVSKELWAWAIAVTTSRSFGLQRAATHSMPAFIDLVDHSLDADVNCTIRSDDDGTINMIAAAPVSSGSCLNLSYGRHDSRSLVLSYGFVLSPPGCNPHDKFSFEFDVGPLMDVISARGVSLERSEPSAWQSSLLTSLGLIPGSGSRSGSRGSGKSEEESEEKPRVNVFLSRDAEQVVDPKLLAAVRVLTLGDDAEALAKSVSLEQLGDWKKPLARQHEIVVLSVIVQLCSAIYRSFPTTIQQDKKILEAVSGIVKSMPSDWVADDGGGVELAVNFRLGLKSVLESALLLTQARKKELMDLQKFS